MKVSDKWFVTSNDGDQVTLRRETDEALEEATLQRPDNTTPSEWLELWPMGAAYGNDEYHDRVRFEAVRRKGAGILTASEKWAVERWNRPDGVPKRCANLLETMRVFLENVGTEDMVGYARMVYLKNSTRAGIAKEYGAIRSNITLMNFLEKWEGGGQEYSEEEMKRLEREVEGMDWKGKS